MKWCARERDPIILARPHHLRHPQRPVHHRGVPRAHGQASGAVECGDQGDTADGGGTVTCAPSISSQEPAEVSTPDASSQFGQQSLPWNGIAPDATSSRSAAATDGGPVCTCTASTPGCGIHPHTPEAWTSSQRAGLAAILALQAQALDWPASTNHCTTRHGMPFGIYCRTGSFAENSPAIADGRGLAIVLGDLAEMGYDARWIVLGADTVGAPHRRDRWWLLARLSDTSTGTTIAQVYHPQVQAMGSEPIW